MSKKSREAILSNLSRVLDPPSSGRRRGANLDGLLNEYAPPESNRPQAQSPTTTPAPSTSLVSNTSLTLNNSLTESTSLIPEIRHTESASLAPEATLALRDASLASNVSLVDGVELAEKSLDLWAGVGELHTGYLRFYGVIVDRLYRHLDPMEQAVYTQLYALSWGYGNPSCRVSLPRLAERAGMGQTAAHKAVKRLASKGMVEKREVTLGKGKDQGVEYWLPLPARLVEDIRLARGARHVAGTTNKEKELKGKSKKGNNRLSPEDIQSFTATVADLLKEGQSIEEVELRFAPTMHPVDWATIRSMALAQAGASSIKS